jgi:hypothetical protein
MMDGVTSRQRLVAWMVVILMTACLMLGLFWYGLSTEVLERMWRDIAERPGGPMAFRFLLQPCMAALAAFHDGSKDAHLNRSPYLWTVLTDRNDSAGRLREGVISTARIILLGLAMDGVYQAIVLQAFYPGEMLLVAILLAFLPYLLLRGPFCRLVRWWSAHKSTDPAS